MVNYPAENQQTNKPKQLNQTARPKLCLTYLLLTIKGALGHQGQLIGSLCSSL